MTNQVFEAPKSAKHIALLDDNENILTSVSIALVNEGYEVSSYTDGNLALEDFAIDKPDLLVLDIKMPAIDGMSFLSQLRKFANIPVIILSSKDDEIDQLLAFKLGADDFITKPFSQRILIERIRALLRRANSKKELAQQSEQEQVIKIADLELDIERRTCKWKNQSLNLTVSEFDLLLELVKRPGLVKTREHLLDILMKDGVFVDDRSIDSHIKRLRKKFKKIDQNFDQIETLYGVGYRYNIE